MKHKRIAKWKIFSSDIHFLLRT